MKGLTKKQRDIVDFIKEFTDAHRYSPSYREIMAHFGFSCVGSVTKHIQALKRKGVLHNEKHCSRSLALSLPAVAPIAVPRELEVPLIGTISAGSPISLYPNTQAISVPKALVQTLESTYALRVSGTSLEEEMIGDGDVLIIEARQHAEPGEVVIALINNHDTIVKRYQPEGAYVRLVGHNPQHRPIILREEDVAIQAVLLGLIRPYK